MQDYFPLDVAAEEAFFDRKIERERLKNNILKNTHTLLTSPRRYGKTSLALRVMAELQVNGANIDMMMATNLPKMQTVILAGIGRAISQIASGKVKLIEKIKKMAQPFSTIESIEMGKLAIKFVPYSNQVSHLVVLEALERLEAIAANLNKKVVLFFDEFQHVLNIEGSIDFEIALRSFAQTAKNVTCLFSGSNRHLLQNMFNDQSRPFYNMCDHLLLERITHQDYRQHLQSLSKKQWKKQLAEKTLELILGLSACHPYFVNALCRRLWSQKELPDIEQVMQQWQQLAAEKRYEISHDFEKLTPIQRTILIELSIEPFAHPTSKTVIQRLDASLSGISNAVEGLLARDYIFRDEQKVYHVLNPLMEYVLRQDSLKIS